MAVKIRSRIAKYMYTSGGIGRVLGVLQMLLSMALKIQATLRSRYTRHLSPVVVRLSLNYTTVSSQKAEAPSLETKKYNEGE